MKQRADEVHPTIHPREGHDGAAVPSGEHPSALRPYFLAAGQPAGPLIVEEPATRASTSSCWLMLCAVMKARQSS